MVPHPLVALLPVKGPGIAWRRTGDDQIFGVWCYVRRSPHEKDDSGAAMFTGKAGEFLAGFGRSCGVDVLQQLDVQSLRVQT